MVGPASVRPVRAQIYWATVADLRKPWVVVSNNARNRHLDSCLAVRVTTSAKPQLDSIVELSPDDPMVGRVLCDDIAELFPDEDGFEYIGGLTPATMMRVDAGLKATLGLR